MPDFAQDRVRLGHVQGLFGVRGWVKLYSHTAPPENIFSYSHWQLWRDEQWHRLRLVEGRTQGKGLVAQLATADGAITDRDIAAEWLGADIAVLRNELPKLAPGEYYGAELLGFSVFTQGANTHEELELGSLTDFMETGANPVMIVRGAREHLIPFIRESYVLNVDLSAQRIEVNWDPEF